MVAITFDTHAFIKRLREAGIPESQAEAHVEAFKAVWDSRSNELATKGDLQIELEKIRREIEIIRREIAESRGDILKWVVGLLFAQTGLIIAAIKLIP